MVDPSTFNSEKEKKGPLDEVICGSTKRNNYGYLRRSRRTWK